MSSMAQTLEYDCYHCGQRCGGRTPGGYQSILGPDGAIHAACSPDDPATRPDCGYRVNGFHEPPGALRGVDPLPVGVEDIRRDVVGTR